MKKFIGGLLVLSLFTRMPSLKTIVYTTFLLGNNSQAISFLSRKRKEDSETDESISESLDSIDENKRKLVDLLRLKNMLVAKINAKMDLFAISKSPLSSKQIQSYQEFSCNNKEHNLKFENLNNEFIENQELDKVKHSLFKLDCNQNYIHDKLKNFLTRLLEAIDLIKDMILNAHKTLTVIS